jgi:hypothetical protein
MVEMQRLGELHKGQAMPCVVGIQQVPSEGEQLAVILDLPVVIERVEFVELAARALFGEGR